MGDLTCPRPTLPTAQRSPVTHITVEHFGPRHPLDSWGPVSLGTGLATSHPPPPPQVGFPTPVEGPAVRGEG